LSTHQCATKYPPSCRHPVRENPLRQLFLAQTGEEKRAFILYNSKLSLEYGGVAACKLRYV
jgi:hypothetical protein